MRIQDGSQVSPLFVCQCLVFLCVIIETFGWVELFMSNIFSSVWDLMMKCFYLDVTRLLLDLKSGLLRPRLTWNPPGLLRLRPTWNPPPLLKGTKNPSADLLNGTVPHFLTILLFLCWSVAKVSILLLDFYGLVALQAQWCSEIFLSGDWIFPLDFNLCHRVTSRVKHVKHWI